MKLFEHPDFRDAVTEAEKHFSQAGQPGLTEQLIEKDYYVTEALRIVATQWPAQVIFKGGTSLSKGWKLIERFSEDIDLFLNRNSFNPPLSNNQVDRELQAIESSVSQHPGLTLDQTKGRRKRGASRESHFNYSASAQFSGISAIPNRLFLEMGTRSGTYPTQIVQLSSYVAEFLRINNYSLQAEDESPFEMLLLDFTRTFVEKLFTIHSKVVNSQREGKSIGTYARHYYDLFCLAQKKPVRQLLQSSAYSDIKQDIDQISKNNFGDYYPPDSLKFSTSPALFPPEKLSQELATEYQEQCRRLCYGSYPAWEEIKACFENLREIL